MLDRIREAWGSAGLDPAEMVAVNQFRNVIVRATDGAYWRMCPEEWSCKLVASGSAEYAALTADAEFRVDWEMKRLVAEAAWKLGPLEEGHCYCLKQPAVIGGQYDAKNFGTITIDELIWFAGDMAKQIKNLPDGAEIILEIQE
jgi:hypothetical protein